MIEGQAPPGTGITTFSRVFKMSAVTVVTATHSSGDVVAQFEISGVSRAPGWTVVLSDIQVFDDSNQKVELGFHLFDRALGTSQTSAQPLAVDLTDVQYRKAYASVTSYEQMTTATAAHAIGQVSGLDKIIQTRASSNSLHVVVVAKGAAAWSASTSLMFDFGFLRD